MAKGPKIDSKDWMKVNPADFGPAVVQAIEAAKNAYAALVASDAYKANEAAKAARESAWAKALIEAGLLEKGRLPIFSRFGDIADPSKHSVSADRTAKTGSGKRVLAAPAALFGKDGKRKA